MSKRESKPTNSIAEGPLGFRSPPRCASRRQRGSGASSRSPTRWPPPCRPACSPGCAVRRRRHPERLNAVKPTARERAGSQLRPTDLRGRAPLQSTAGRKAPTASSLPTSSAVVELAGRQRLQAAALFAPTRSSGRMRRREPSSKSSPPRPQALPEAFECSAGARPDPGSGPVVGQPRRIRTEQRRLESCSAKAHQPE